MVWYTVACTVINTWPFIPEMAHYHSLKQSVTVVLWDHSFFMTLLVTWLGFPETMCRSLPREMLHINTFWFFSFKGYHVFDCVYGVCIPQRHRDKQNKTAKPGFAGRTVYPVNDCLKSNLMITEMSKFTV